MKNYYTQLSELRIAEERLNTLQEKKKLLETNITNITSQLKDVTTSGGVPNDKMTSYVIKCEEIDKEIEELQKEIKVLKKGLSKMEDILKNISGIEERIFRLYFVENKNPTQISFIIPCDRTTVYRYLKRIGKKLEYKK